MMIGSTLFELGYMLNLLPIYTSECAKGESDIFQKRLEAVEKLLMNLDMEPINFSLKIFEKLLITSDPINFIQNKYDNFNKARDVCQKLVYQTLNQKVQKNAFKLGVAVGQYQINTVAENVPYNDISTTHLLIKELLSEVFEDIFLPEHITHEMNQYQNNATPLTEYEVLELKDKIVHWFLSFSLES